MIVFLDAAVVIYFVEQPAGWGDKATTRIAALRTAGDSLAVSDLVRMECLVGPLRSRDAARVAAFTSFFALSDVQVLPIPSRVCDRAAHIRAGYNFKPLDSLHLATAVEQGCGLFLTNDAQLARFTDLSVGILT